MKTLAKFKLILGLSLVTIVGLISLNSFSTINKNKVVAQISDSVNITIDSDTSDEELDDILLSSGNTDGLSVSTDLIETG